MTCKVCPTLAQQLSQASCADKVECVDPQTVRVSGGCRGEFQTVNGTTFVCASKKQTVNNQQSWTVSLCNPSTAVTSRPTVSKQVAEAKAKEKEKEKAAVYAPPKETKAKAKEKE